MGDVAGVHGRPLEGGHLGSHVNLWVAVTGKTRKKLNHAMRELEIIRGQWTEQALEDGEQIHQIITVCHSVMHVGLLYLDGVGVELEVGERVLAAVGEVINKHR